MFRQILVPLDGSTFAEAALPVALSLRRSSGAKLHLVTVHEPDLQIDVYGLAPMAAQWSDGYLDTVVSRLDEEEEGLDVSTRVLSGHIASGIEAEADEIGADLVVLASHGRGAVSRMWLGSVTDHFVRHTDRPVMVVRPTDVDASPSLDARVAVRRILVPLDGSELSEGIFPHALHLGSLYDASYHLVRVVPFPRAPSSSYLPHAAELNREAVAESAAEAEAYLWAHHDRLAGEGLDVTHGVVVVPQPARGILAEAAARQCDVIAMATHGRGGLSRAILGSTTDKVLRGTERMLLLVREGAGEET